MMKRHETEAALWTAIEIEQAKGFVTSQRTISEDYVMVRMFRAKDGAESVHVWEVVEA